MFSTIGLEVAAQARSRFGPFDPELTRSYAHRQLDRVMKTARVVPFDDTSRICFLSDCHRGDGGRADPFVANRALFLAVLEHYYQQGFTYVEVGDGDDLWKNRFSDVRCAYAPVFDLLHRFQEQGRLHVIVGNHDVFRGRRDQMEKDGLVAHEGLFLRHAHTGQQILVVHGHQADPSDRIYLLGRFIIRNIWKRLQLVEVPGTAYREPDLRRINKIEQNLISWCRTRRQIVICGHTHRPALPRYGAPPYFNTGSCVFAGHFTGLELQNGGISLVRWTARPGARPGEILRIERELLAPTRRVEKLAPCPSPLVVVQ